jgi:hypothetical protein
MRTIQSSTIQYLKAKLRQMLLTADPHERPEMLIRLTLLWGAYFEQIAHQMTAVMEELREEFGISESAVADAIKTSPLLREIWPTS